MKDMRLEKIMGNLYRDLLILIYFKQFGSRYSIEDLKRRLGLSFIDIMKTINRLINIGYLFVNEKKSLSLTLSGRIRLGNSKLENFKYIENDVLMIEKIENDIFYLPKKMSNAKWINKVEIKHTY